MLPTFQYNDGTPDDSRYAHHSSMFKETIDALKTPEGREQIRKVKELTNLAEQGICMSMPVYLTFIYLIWVFKK